MLIALLKDSSRRVNLKRNLTFIFNSNLQTTTVSERLNLRSSLGLKWNHKQFCAQKKGMEDQMFKDVTPQKFLSGFEM